MALLQGDSLHGEDKQILVLGRLGELPVGRSGFPPGSTVFTHPGRLCPDDIGEGKTRPRILSKVLRQLDHGLLERFREVLATVQPNIMALVVAYLFYRHNGETIRSYWTLRNRIFEERMQALENAQKELKLTVTQARLYWGFSAIRCIVYLKVETGDGYSNEFEGNNASPATLYRACDGAITRAVAAMLNDDMILNYIKY